MPADPNIYNAFSQPARSATDYANAFLTNQAQRQAIGVNALKMQGEQQTLDQQQATNNERNALRSYVAGKDLSDPTVQQGIYQVAPLTGGSFIKGLNDNQKTQAETTHLGAQTQDSLAKAALTKTQHAIEVQSQIAQAAGAAVDQASWDRGLQIAKTLGADVSQIPAQFDPAVAKTIHDQALTGAQQLDAHYKQMTADETARHNKADESNTVRGQNITAADAAAGIKKDLAVAGLNPDGGVNANQEAMAQLIAAGKAPAPSGMAAARPGVGALMARVSQINPEYDATSYNAKNAAAKGFTSGSQGNALRSISTASDHLAQLDQLGDALQNGQMPIINKIGNAYGQATGAPPAQVFNAVKGVVGQEVVKAIVAGGGSAGERDEAAKAFSSDSSPAQLKQTIAAYRSIMGAQKQNLMEQRRAAGLPDSTMPNYQAPGGGAASPAAGIDPNAIAAELAKRGVK